MDLFVKFINKLKAVGVISLGISSAAFSQKVDHYNNVWFTVNLKYQLAEKWSVNSEFHARRTNWLKDDQQYLVRPTLNYSPNEKIEYSIGYTYVSNHPYGNFPLIIVTPENNIWEQVTLKHKLNKFSFLHRFRLEQRFIGKRVLDPSGDYKIEGYDFRNRFRYRFSLKRPIISNEKLKILFFEEVWLNFNDAFMPVALDQNWFFLGLEYDLLKNLSISVGYMDQVFIRNTSLSNNERNPTLQFGFNVNF